MSGLIVFSLTVAALAVFLGWALQWGGRDKGGKRLLDPTRLDWEMLNDPSLSETERAFVREMTVLEMTRRHICC